MIVSYTGPFKNIRRLPVYLSALRYQREWCTGWDIPSKLSLLHEVFTYCMRANKTPRRESKRDMVQAECGCMRYMRLEVAVLMRGISFLKEGNAGREPAHHRVVVKFFLEYRKTIWGSELLIEGRGLEGIVNIVRGEYKRANNQINKYFKKLKEYV